MGTLFGWLFSGAWQWLLGKLGISTDQKLGRAEIQNQDLTTELKTEKDALDVENKVAGMSPATVDAELRQKWK
jgi:hypothetical protein